MPMFTSQRNHPDRHEGAMELESGDLANDWGGFVFWPSPRWETFEVVVTVFYMDDLGSRTGHDLCIGNASENGHIIALYFQIVVF